MIKIPPCDLPMVPLAAENVQDFLVTIGKNGTNSTIGRFADFTIGRTPNVAAVFCLHHLLPYVGNIGTIGTNGITNGTIGKILNGICLPMVPFFTIGKNYERTR